MKGKLRSYRYSDSVQAVTIGLILCMAVVIMLSVVVACENPVNTKKPVGTEKPAGTEKPVDVGKPNSQPQPSFNVEITGADSQLTVTWNEIEDASVYEVWLDGIKIGETPIAMKVITGLENQRIYHVVIRAQVDGRYVQSNPGSGTPISIPIPPGTPEGLRILADNRSLIASWQPVAGAISYEVFLDNDYLDEVRSPQIEITDLKNDVPYTVQVQAKNGVGVSSRSLAASRAPDQYIGGLSIGYGFNLLGPLSPASFSLRLILNPNKLNEDDAYVMSNSTSSDWSVKTAETLGVLTSTQNQSLGMNASIPFKAVILSPGASGGWLRSSSERVERQYALIRAEHFIRTVGLNPMLIEPYELRRYFTDGFLYALDHETPKELFAHYGHALLVRYRLGGNMEIYVTNFNSKKETLQQFRSSFNADVSFLAKGWGASLKGESSSSSSVSEWRNDSEIRFLRNAGELSHALTLEDAFSEYPSWVSSIEANPSFGGVDSYLGSFIPLWDIAKGLGKHTLAQSLRDEFARLAMERADEFESIYPGEWFTSEERLYTPGSGIFIHQQQLITNDDGTKYPAMVRYVFYVAGAGAGGNGYSSWGVSGSLNGGAGGGGCLEKIVLKSDQGITATIMVGAGGTAGTEMRGHAWPGPGVSSGGGSSVTLYEQTFTAGGGQPSGYSDYRYHPAPGGVGTPLVPPAFVDEYVIANGGATNGVWNQPGVGGKIDTFSAGTGGVGGTYSGGGTGRLGENGWVRIIWSFYDGQ